MDKNIKEVITGTNVKLLKTLPAESKNTALEVVAFVYEDDSIDLYQYDSVYETRKDFVQSMMQMLKDNGIRNNQITKLDVNSKKIKTIIKEAAKSNETLDEIGVDNLVYDPEAVKKDHKFIKGLGYGIAGSLIVGTLSFGGYQLHEKLTNKEEQPTTEPVVTNDIQEETGYGFYKYDLSSMEDMSEYEIEVVDSEQKQGALNRLNILRNFNQEITLVDGETKQLAGLTIEQLIAVDAYANSNIYEREDYIKNFGLYDFSSVTDDFQQAVLVTGACLANPEFDGTVIADIFKDEAVKSNYLKQLEYRDKILKAESTKEQKKLAKEYVEFLNDCSINQASSEYLDYDQHPGMAFVTSSVVNALNYHNIVLDKEIVSELIIIGDGEENSQSKLNSICADANSKIDSAIEFVDIMEKALVLNETNIVYNENEKIKAEAESRNPVLLSLQYEELDTLIRESLCDQKQINELTNKTLEKEEKLVTVEEQKVVLANAVNIQVELLNSGKGYYKNEQTAKLASQLQNVGDTATVTQKSVQITTPEEVKKIEEKAPEQTSQAKDELNQRENLIDNTTQQAQDQINKDIENVQNEGVNYYNQVMNYYELHGEVVGIPSELQAAYNNLGSETYNLAKQTGVARYMTKDENKYSGGETNITIDSSIDVSDVSTNSVSDNVTTTTTTPVIPNNTPAVEEEIVETPEATVPNNSGNVENNNSNSTSNGEIQINPEFEGVEIGDISTDPVSYDVPTGFAPIVSEETMNYSTYSLADIYGIDEYSDFSESYSNDESGKIR